MSVKKPSGFDEAEDARRNVLSASRSSLIQHVAHVLSAPQYRHPLDLYVIVSALILGTLWPWNHFLAAHILQIIIMIHGPCMVVDAWIIHA